MFSYRSCLRSCFAGLFLIWAQILGAVSPQPETEIADDSGNLELVPLADAEYQAADKAAETVNQPQPQTAAPTKIPQDLKIALPLNFPFTYGANSQEVNLEFTPETRRSLLFAINLAFAPSITYQIQPTRWFTFEANANLSWNSQFLPYLRRDDINTDLAANSQHYLTAGAKIKPKFSFSLLRITPSFGFTYGKNFIGEEHGGSIDSQKLLVEVAGALNDKPHSMEQAVTMNGALEILISLLNDALNIVGTADYNNFHYFERQPTPPSLDPYRSDHDINLGLSGHYGRDVGLWEIVGALGGGYRLRFSNNQDFGLMYGVDAAALFAISYDKQFTLQLNYSFGYRNYYGGEVGKPRDGNKLTHTLALNGSYAFRNNISLALNIAYVNLTGINIGLLNETPFRPQYLANNFTVTATFSYTIDALTNKGKKQFLFDRFALAGASSTATAGGCAGGICF